MRSTPVERLSALVTLRIQLWLQELRRVLATVSRDPADIDLRSEAAVLSQRERLRLPVVQCRHCHTTGWLTLKQPQDSRVVNSPDKIYASFFARYPDTFIARIYPRPACGRREPACDDPLVQPHPVRPMRSPGESRRSPSARIARATTCCRCTWPARPARLRLRVDGDAGREAKGGHRP